MLHRTEHESVLAIVEAVLGTPGRVASTLEHAGALEIRTVGSSRADEVA